LTVKADLPSSAYETTQYVYGVTTGSGSAINSNDILSATQYPDPSTGNPSSSQQETYTVDALGEMLTKTDRNGNAHTDTFDVLSRQTSDAVTTLGSGVDGAVRRLTTAYDTGDRPYVYTSYNAASGGSVVNQVQQAYNGLGQLITEYQSSSGTVNTGSTPNVQYAYSQMAGGANHSRLISMTYPNGRVLNFNYNGVDDTISRLSSISDTSATLEASTYLGLDTVVKRAHPQPGVDLTYIKRSGEANGDAGDQYAGLDRFGRVVDQRWLVTSSGTATDRFQYGYDRNDNRLYRNNLVNSSFGELYHVSGAGNGYDNLNQLVAFSRGVLSASGSTLDTIASPSHSQSWTFDALGNWTNVTTDANSQNRTANKQNEITSISGLTTPGYDSNGNTTTDQAGKTLVYDAWNRFVSYKSGSTVLESDSYDALGRRIIVNPGTATTLFYSSAWQVVEERQGSSTTAQYVWSPVYLDALIERDRGSERFYVEQDANWNVTSIIDTTGAVQERYIEDPYGAASVLAPDWSARTSSLFAWMYLHQGSRLDSTTGLYLLRDRDYSPSLGRWSEVDPLGLQAGDANLYRAWQNNPPTTRDPDGLQPQQGQQCPARCDGVIPVLRPDGGVQYVRPGDLPPRVTWFYNLGVMHGTSQPYERPNFNHILPLNTKPPARGDAVDCLIQCIMRHYGLTATGAGLFAIGQPVIRTRPKFYGMTGGTSILSLGCRKLLPFPIPRVWAPTLANPVGQTSILGAAIGRWVPWVGGSLLAVDAAVIAACQGECQYPRLNPLPTRPIDSLPPLPP
jgi:RHS repeat-associated protein